MHLNRMRAPGPHTCELCRWNPPDDTQRTQAQASRSAESVAANSFPSPPLSAPEPGASSGAWRDTTARALVLNRTGLQGYGDSDSVSEAQRDITNGINVPSSCGSSIASSGSSGFSCSDDAAMVAQSDEDGNIDSHTCSRDELDAESDLREASMGRNTESTALRTSIERQSVRPRSCDFASLRLFQCHRLRSLAERLSTRTERCTCLSAGPAGGSCGARLRA